MKYVPAASPERSPVETGVVLFRPDTSSMQVVFEAQFVLMVANSGVKWACGSTVNTNGLAWGVPSVYW